MNEFGLKFSFLTILTSLAFSSLAYSDGYDQCKDILRDGLKDKLSTQNSVDYKVARHKEFCNISKEYILNESNFSNFARDYAKQVKTHQSREGGGMSIGYGPFSFGGNYNASRAGGDLSESEREALLIDNRKQVMDYFNQNCGSESYEESLKSEATLLSLIANSNVVNAWKECMLSYSGLFVELKRGGKDRYSVDYHLAVHWKSNENTKITNVKLQFKNSKVEAPYKTFSENKKWTTTENICDEFGCLRSGGNLMLSVTHTDLESDASVVILGMTNTGVTKSHMFVLPQMTAPEPVRLENSPAGKYNPSAHGQMSCAAGFIYGIADCGCPNDGETYVLLGMEAFGNDQGKWSFMLGITNANESTLDGALRIIQEETVGKYDVTRYDLKNSSFFKSQAGIFFVRQKIIGSSKFREALQSEQRSNYKRMSDYAWVKLADLTRAIRSGSSTFATVIPSGAPRTISLRPVAINMLNAADREGFLDSCFISD